MTDDPLILARRLSDEGQKTKDFFIGINQEEWSVVLYSDGGGWTIKQLLAHIVASEVGNRQMIEEILRGGMGSPENFDLDDFNQGRVKDLESIPQDKLLVMFQDYRRSIVDLVKNLNSQDMVLKGRNPYLGITALEDIIKLVYRHVQIHLRDARRHLNQHLSSEAPFE